MMTIGLGVVMGLLMGLTGAGGGVLGVPILIFGLKLEVSEAGPIALFAVGLAAALGATLGLRARLVRYRAAAFIAIIGMALSPLGLWTAHRVPSAPLAGIFGLVLAWVAVRMLRHIGRAAAGGTPRTAHPVCARDPVGGRFIWTGPCAGALAGCGVLAGFLSGLLGVGGGFVIVPMLSRISDLPMQSIAATSLAVITLVSASGVIFATLGGGMDWTIAALFAGGAVAGMLGAQTIAGRVAGEHLQQVFATIAALVAVAMLYKSASAMGWLSLG